MKKFLPLLSFAILAFVAGSSAQELRLGATGAMNVSSYAMSSDGVKFDSDSRFGFKAGLQMELSAPFIADGFYFDFGALLSSKGAKMSSTVGDVDISWTSRPYYIEMPMHLGYNLDFGESSKITVFGSFGPYIAVGLWGSDKVTLGEESSKPDTFASDGLKRFDFGLGLKVGVRMFDHYRLFLGYDWGLLDVSQMDDTKWNNRNFYIGASYMF